MLLAQQQLRLSKGQPQLEEHNEEMTGRCHLGLRSHKTNDKGRSHARHTARKHAHSNLQMDGSSQPSTRQKCPPLTAEHLHDHRGMGKQKFVPMFLLFLVQRGVRLYQKGSNSP